MFRHKQVASKLFFLVLFVMQLEEKIVAFSSIRPPIQLASYGQDINGEHISLEFYKTIDAGNYAKNELQSLLYNFLENLQKNLSSSHILSTELAKTTQLETKRCHLGKLNDLADYFQHSSEAAELFVQKAEIFFKATKNECYLLLLKLRQVPSTTRFLPISVKTSLTDYFVEMEFFNVIFSEITDQAYEYIADTLRSMQRVFMRYADIQREILRTWNFKSDEWCCNYYMDFLQQWSAQIFKCGTSNELLVAYDVYATTETYAKYITKQLEFRIQRIYNCFIFNNYKLRCQFLYKPEQDFKKIFAKLDELQQYFDIKIKRGRVTFNRFHTHRRRRQGDYDYNDKCIPQQFPNIQMNSSLKTCFYVPKIN